MDTVTIEQIVHELRAAIVGRKFGKIFVLSRFSVAIDLRLADGRYLFVSAEPSNPRIYLIQRRLRDLEKISFGPTPFVMQMRKRLSGAEVDRVDKLPDERVIGIGASGTNELGEPFEAGIVAQLTGKSANLFLMDGKSIILDALRETHGEGQRVGDIYSPPEQPANSKTSTAAHARRAQYAHSVQAGSISEALDSADLERQAESELRSLANTAQTKVVSEIAKLERLQARLRGDLKAHGDPEQWKRMGDLLLANVATAKRHGSRVEVIDYFDESVPVLLLEVDEHDSLTEAAERYFKRYTKARNAREEIARRIGVIDTQLEHARNEKVAIESEIELQDIEALRGRIRPSSDSVRGGKKNRTSLTSSVARKFISSDGFEILVGKRAKDNDQVTFKLAKSLDTWMHAADYPGSHVVIRNRDRKEIPPATLLEGAQLAAFYSQGKAQPKAAVHYTQKKFVNKPRGAAPGLVSVASFKTLLVEPVFPSSVTKKD